MQPDSLRTNFDRILNDPLLIRLFVLLAAVVVVLLLARLARRALASRLENRAARYRTRKFITFFSYVVVILLAAGIFSDRSSGFTVAIGVVGAGIAFALQEVITSVAGWLAVTFGSFYKPGDRVLLGGIKGDVIDISILRTTLFEVGEWVHGDQYNGRVVRVANSFVFKEPVYNYSGDFPFLWDEVRVPIRHGSDRAATRALLLKAVNEVGASYVREARETWSRLTRTYLIEDARVDPTVTLSMDENWMTYTVRYVVDYDRRGTMKDALFNKIMDLIDASDGRVSVASASQEITVMPPSTVHVDVDKRPTTRD